MPTITRKQNAPADHGTLTAYKRHQRNGDKPCDACRKAKADYSAERRRIRDAPGPADPTWMDRSACRPGALSAEAWDEMGALEQAEVCAGCPVASECLQYARHIHAHQQVYAGRWMYFSNPHPIVSNLELENDREASKRHKGNRRERINQEN